MKKLKTESLAGHNAWMITRDGDPVMVKFADDVKLICTCAESGDRKVSAARSDITGHLETSKDYSKTRNAKLALEDGSTFAVWFFGPQIFAAQFHPSM